MDRHEWDCDRYEWGKKSSRTKITVRDAREDGLLVGIDGDDERDTECVVMDWQDAVNLAVVIQDLYQQP